MNDRRHPRDGGNVTLEAVVLTPALLMFIALIIAAGRVTLAGGSIEAAARDAARQASIARDPVTDGRCGHQWVRAATGHRRRRACRGDLHGTAERPGRRWHAGKQNAAVQFHFADRSMAGTLSDDGPDASAAR
jgi:hypothetical protein